jgi:membrane-bound lytic murein transglycosylase C
MRAGIFQNGLRRNHLSALTIKSSLPVNLCRIPHNYCRLRVCALILYLFMPASFSDEYASYRNQQNREIALNSKNQEATIREKKREFERYRIKSRAEYDRWYSRHTTELAAFRKEIAGMWGAYRTPSATVWVEYAVDKRSVCVVDFEKGVASVAVLIPDSASGEQVERVLAGTIARTLTSGGCGQSIPAGNDTVSAVCGQPVLQNQVADASGEIITVSGVSAFAKGLMEKTVITRAPAQDAGDHAGSIAVEVSFPLVSDHTALRVKRFLPLINKYCAKYGLDRARVLATIHTESHFNPMAVSDAGAIGLMQLVPESGASEAYTFVYGSHGIPGEDFLFDPERNIELGCAYIHLLDRRYFAAIEDTSRMQICAIAAYNTGPANVAYAFTADRSIPAAIVAVNRMRTARMVFDLLLTNLPYPETKQYLIDVTERMKLYD